MAALRKWSSGGTAHAHLGGDIVHHKAFQQCRSWRSITDHITRSTGPFIFTRMPSANPRSYHNDKRQLWGPTAFDGLRADHQLNVLSQHMVYLLKYLAHLKLSSHTPATLARNNLMFHRNHMGWTQITELAMGQALHGFLKWPWMSSTFAFWSCFSFPPTCKPSAHDESDFVKKQTSHLRGFRGTDHPPEWVVQLTGFGQLAVPPNRGVEPPQMGQGRRVC